MFYFSWNNHASQKIARIEERNRRMDNHLLNLYPSGACLVVCRGVFLFLKNWFNLLRNLPDMSKMNSRAFISL